MDADRLRAIYKYGALASAAASVIAVLAYATNGHNSVIGLFLGWSGPLGFLLFSGSYLTQATSRRVLGEELTRGVVWYFVSLLAWSVIITQTAALSATPFTVFGLPAATALALVLSMVGFRRATGRELKNRTEDGRSLQLLFGTVVLGFVVVFLVLAGEVGWWALGVYFLSIPTGLALRSAMRDRYPGAFEPADSS